MIRVFEGRRLAELYKKFRQPTPDIVVRKAMGYLEEVLPRPHGTAVDVGCGSGQNTLCFAPFFRKVLGFDVSPAQLDEARNIPDLPTNVQFGSAPAETLPVEDGSVEFVTCGCSIHWFDFDRFYAEVNRVLASNGVLAAHCYLTHNVVHPHKGAELNQLIDAFVKANIVESKHLHPRNTYPFNEYRNLPLPYKNNVLIRGMMNDVPLTVADVSGAYTTWPSIRADYEENPQKVLGIFKDFEAEFLKIMGVSTRAEETPIIVRYEYFLAMCRKPPAST